MRPTKLVLRTFIRQPVDAVFKWHLQRNAILRGFPCWGRWQFLNEEEIEGNQTRLTYIQKSFLFKRKTTLRLQFDIPRKSIRISQEKGYVRKFVGTIEVRPHSTDSCELVERLEFLVRHSWFFGHWRSEFAKKMVKGFFAYRHETMLKDLEFSKEYGDQEKKRILISGTRGLVGKSLRIFLESMGHDVYSLTRKKTNGKWDIYFNDKTGEVERDKLEGFDVVCHLRGQGVFARWTNRKKKELIRSRVDSTKKLSHILALLHKPPKVFVCASAVGYYGDRGEEKLTEKSEPGKGSFLSELTSMWEESSKILIRKNVRVSYMRFGIILSMGGGALGRMLWPIRLGIAGTLGDGKQYVSWIALEDAISAIAHSIFRDQIAGPVNVVSPNPVTNYELSCEIASLYDKGLGPKVPAGLIRLFSGEMGDELLLASTRCYPSVLLNSGFRFRYPTIKETLKRVMPPL